MKKSGVVLLITIFFIMSISALIFKNLEDSQKFIDEVSLDISLAQLNITKKNIEDEVIKLANKYKDNIDELLIVSSASIPFNYADIDMIITLDEYDYKQCEINNIKSVQWLYEKCDENLTESILYPYDFVEYLKKYKPFKNKQQINYFLQEYQQDTKDDKIYLVKDEFEYLQKPSQNERYLKCSYSAEIDGINSNGEFIFKLGTNSILSSNLWLNQN